MKVWYVCLFAVLITGCKGSDDSITPPVSSLRITSISPSSISLGARSVIVTITGAGFSGNSTVDIGSGIEIINTTVRDIQTMQLTLNISPTASVGPRTVILTSGGTSARLENGLTVSDNHAPVASFIVNPSAGTVNSTFQLDASSSMDDDGSITGYKWEISDGTNPQGKRVQKVFESKGTYTVRLTVLDNKGGISCASRQLDVGDNLPPVAVLAVDATKGTQFTVFTFDASGSVDPDGGIKSYLWNFENGSENGRVVTHKFKNAGNYIVELQVKDTQGASAFDRRTINVEFFDKEKAIEEISDVVLDFLKQFDKFENLPTEDVVRGFSKDSDCRGRAREIQIIDQAREDVRSASVEFLGDPKVSYVDDQKGKANISNRFFGTYNDGSNYSSGVITHNFTMVNENGTWLICGFTLGSVSIPANFPSFLSQNQP